MRDTEGKRNEILLWIDHEAMEKKEKSRTMSQFLALPTGWMEMPFTETEKHEKPKIRQAMPNSLLFLKCTMLFHASIPGNILSSALGNLTSPFSCFEGAVLYLIAYT